MAKATTPQFNILTTFFFLYSCPSNDRPLIGDDDRCLPYHNGEGRSIRPIQRHHAEFHQSNAGREHQLRGVRVLQPITWCQYDVMSPRAVSNEFIYAETAPPPSMAWRRSWKSAERGAAVHLS